MIQTGFEKRVRVQQIVESQLPDFLRAESPKTIDFLKQYYASQEFQSGPYELYENLDHYLKFDNLTPEVIRSDYVILMYQPMIPFSIFTRFPIGLWSFQDR